MVCDYFLWYEMTSEVKSCDKATPHATLPAMVLYMQCDICSKASGAAFDHVYTSKHMCIAHHIAEAVAEEEKKGRKPRPNKLHP